MRPAALVLLTDISAKYIVISNQSLLVNWLDEITLIRKEILSGHDKFDRCSNQVKEI